MIYYQLRIKPTSLQLTPWQADTVFGSLCWALLHRKGESVLENFLTPFRQNDPPFLLSDGIPTGYFPLPLSQRFIDMPDADNQESYSKQKTLKKLRYIKQEHFEQARNGQTVDFDDKAHNIVKTESQLHNTIDRITGTTKGSEDGPEMSLFQLNGWVLRQEEEENKEKVCNADTITLYFTERHEGSVNEIMPCFRDMELTGYGKKKSSGMGAFQIVGDLEPWIPAPVNQPANGFVSLSSFVPKREDPTEGFWQFRVKHGKFGERFAVSQDPFKKPWLHFEPGSTFCDSPVKEFYGCMLTGLSGIHREAVQYCYAFPLPVHLPDPIMQKIRL